MALRFDQWRRSSTAKALGKPVISVGNITAGGTGKTPVLFWLAEYLDSRGKKVAVLTRGYQGMGQRGSQAENDETLLLKLRCPYVSVGVGANRWDAAQTLMAHETPDVFLLDDGFQHWPLKRDLDIVCIDATDPWGGGWLLPAGRLREPTCALRRADVVVINRLELVSEIERRDLLEAIESSAVGIPTFVSTVKYRLFDVTTRADVSLNELKGRDVIALSAIGNPAAFEQTLQRFGARVTAMRSPDHYAYTVDDLQRVRKKSPQPWIVMTEKDWVKIKQLKIDHARLFVLQMNLLFAPAEQNRLHALLDQVFA